MERFLDTKVAPGADDLALHVLLGGVLARKIFKHKIQSNKCRNNP